MPKQTNKKSDKKKWEKPAVSRETNIQLKGLTYPTSCGSGEEQQQSLE